MPDEPDDNLKIIYSTIREEINYRRSREQQIFTWSSAILIAVAGTMLISEVKASSPIITWLGILSSESIVVLVSYGSIYWQMKQRILLSKSQILISQVMKEMGLFDVKSNNVKILPVHWETWGTRNNTLCSQLISPSKLLCTILLGIAALLAICSRCYLVLKATL